MAREPSITRYNPELAGAMLCSSPSGKSWPFRRKSAAPGDRHRVAYQPASHSRLDQPSSSNPHPIKQKLLLSSPRPAFETMPEVGQRCPPGPPPCCDMTNLA